MNRYDRTLTRTVRLVLGLAATSPAAAQSTRVWTDPMNDTVIRRTDVGNSADLLPGANLPDLLSVTIGGWSATNPSSDPYTGSFVAAAGADLLRIDVVIKGLVNPPGPISSVQGFHVPDLFGPNPAYAYIEFDADADSNTGGEENFSDTYLGQAARFAARPQSLPDRAITGATDFESDCLTPPFFRRTGSEFALGLCGCFTADLLSQNGDMDSIMEANETFITCGPYFIRTNGYSAASFAFGGFFPGYYDPDIQVRFKHTSASDTTTISVVFPLTMHGYALLHGLQTDPVANFDVDDAFSVFEALRDVIIFCNTQPLGFCVQPIAQSWAGRNAADYLNVTTWRASALVGTTYATTPVSGFNVWTDYGFDALFKDVTGDGLISAADATAVQAYITQYDGNFFEDEDGIVNGSIKVPSFAYYYSLFDIDYNGYVDSSDLSMFPSTCRVNWDGIGGVTSDDFFAFMNDFFELNADFNLDGTTNTADFFAFINEFFMGCP